MFYRVANLPIEKVCLINNFYEANFSDFKLSVVTLKTNPKKYNRLKRLANPSKIHFQAQTGVLL